MCVWARGGGGGGNIRLCVFSHGKHSGGNTTALRLLFTNQLTWLQVPERQPHLRSPRRTFNAPTCKFLLAIASIKTRVWCSNTRRHPASCAPAHGCASLKHNALLVFLENKIQKPTKQTHNHRKRKEKRAFGSPCTRAQWLSFSRFAAKKKTPQKNQINGEKTQELSANCRTGTGRVRACVCMRARSSGTYLRLQRGAQLSRKAEVD